jgi:hypothetical protein
MVENELKLRMDASFGVPADDGPSHLSIWCYSNNVLCGLIRSGSWALKQAGLRHLQEGVEVCRIEALRFRIAKGKTPS